MVSTLLKSLDVHVHFVVVLTDKTANGPSSKKSKNEKKKGKNSGNEKENVSCLIYFALLYCYCFRFVLFVCLVVCLCFFLSAQACYFYPCTQVNDFPQNHHKGLT